jgi:RNA polymerase sigma factor (sigma-70 family)
VALSDHAVRGLAQIKAAHREHLQARGGEPTKADLAARTGFTQAQLESLLAVDRTPRSFEEPLGTDGSATATFGEMVVDPGAEAQYDHVLDAMEVKAFAAQLDDRERMVLWGHYGLGRAPQTLSEIGAAMGVTAERVRQIEANALEKLREAAVESGGPGAYYT